MMREGTQTERQTRGQKVGVGENPRTWARQGQQGSTQPERTPLWLRISGECTNINN